MSSEQKQDGKLIVVSAPSGAGKTTIVKYLLEQIPELNFSISACSRPCRNNEQDGKDYYFITPEEFRRRIDADQFVEWEEVYPGNYYGTLKSEIDRIWSEGKHVIFDVDVVGGKNLKSRFGEKALALFIMPPSVNHLEERLRNRETETPETLARRLDKAERELTAAPEFDMIIVNDNLEEAKQEALKQVRMFLSQSE